MRTFVVTACVLLVTSVGGCTEAPSDRIRFGLPTAPVTLDPRFATDAVSDRLVRLLHRRLVDFDEHALPVPELASWQALSPTRYRFVLDPDARFSNGQPVTAADVAATYRSVLDRATGSPHRASLANIASVSVDGPQVVEFTLHRPDFMFPATLVVGVLAAADLAADGAQDAFAHSSGRFARRRWDSDGTLVLERRRDGALFEFVPVRDPTVRALKLVGGELDLIQGNVPPEVFAWLGSRAGLKAERVPGSTFAYLGFNLAEGGTIDPRVRRALAHAVDRAPIIEHLFGGLARPAAGLFPPEHWAGTDAPQVPAHDPLRARALLAEAGHAGRPLELEYKTSADPFRLRIATVLQAQFAAVGVDLDIRSLDWGTFYGDVRHGRFELYALSWVGLRLPDIYRYAFHSESTPPAGANRGRYRSAVADALIVAAEQAASRAERARLYAELQRQLLDDLPYIPLWFENQLVVRRQDIHGYVTDASGHFDALDQTYRKHEPVPR